ncbi:MAG: hypothetical protein CBE24_06305 [bacterium TMED264]|nr:MAG: hypothetical protein CBE24_06305 [bacterium TMED264]
MKKIITILFISFLFGIDNDLLIKTTHAVKIGKYEEAITYINKAENNNQKNPEFFRLKALIFEMLNEPYQAKKAWGKCLKYSKDKNMRHEARIHIQNLSEKK